MEPPLSPCSCLLVLCPQKQTWKKHTKCLYPPLPTSHSNTQTLGMSVSTARLPGRPGGALCIAWEVSAASGERGSCYDFSRAVGGVGEKEDLVWPGKLSLGARPEHQAFSREAAPGCPTSKPGEPYDLQRR